ncbi:MAG: integrase repeat-containing protein [bacterium]|nr:integrase repeat-containing protein [bacterium]
MVTLHYYQNDCLKATDRVRKNGKGRALVVMASGLGKTVVAAFDAKRFRESSPDARVLYLCHQNNILEQAHSTFTAINGSQHTYGFFTGVEKNGHAAQFLFASLQTMRKHKGLFRPDEFPYIVVDESHHTYADTYLDVVEYWKPKFLLGVTATPDRTDGEDIRRVFGKEVFFLPIDEALAQELLTPVDYRLLTDEIQMQTMLETPQGKMSITKLNKLIFVPRRDEEIAKIILKHAEEFAAPRIIIFCESVIHCDHLARYLPDSLPFHSKIHLRERVVRLELFRQGIVSTLITVDVFNEGMDIPEANILAFLRSTASPTVFFQQLGRGLRKSEGKDKVLALDFVGNCERIRMILDLWEAVKKSPLRRPAEEAGKTPRNYSTRTLHRAREPFTLNVNTVEFKEKVMRILDIIRTRNFYPTLQEAQEAVLTLGIEAKYGQKGYRNRYREDPRLPSSPETLYSTSWKGWGKFLGKSRKATYKTLLQASKAAKKLNIATSIEYRGERYKEDPRLPRNPEEEYEDKWEDWGVFLGTGSGTVKNPYATWQEAGKAAIKLSITSHKEYTERRKEDLCLPGAPPQHYADFPGWGSFLKTGNKAPRHIDAYPTWQEAARSVQALGITSSKYASRYKEDARLPWNPWKFYKDFPGWDIFLGRKK